MSENKSTARPWFSGRSRAAHRTLHFSLIFVGLEWLKFHWLLVSFTHLSLATQPPDLTCPITSSW